MMTEMLPGIHFDVDCAAGSAEPLWVPERTEASPATGQELWLSTRWTGTTSASSTKPWEQQSQGHVASLYRVWADTSRSLTPDSIHDLCLCCFPVAQRGAQSLGSSPVTVSRVPRLSCLLKHGWSVWQLRNLGRGHHIRLGCDVPHPTVPFGFT